MPPLTKQIQRIEDVDDLRQFVGEKFDIISECGFTKPSSRLSLSTDRIDLVQCVALHHVILKTLGELSQFRDGLESLGALKAIQGYGELLRDFFVIKKPELTAGVCMFMCDRQNTLIIIIML